MPTASAQAAQSDWLAAPAVAPRRQAQNASARMAADSGADGMAITDRSRSVGRLCGAYLSSPFVKGKAAQRAQDDVSPSVRLTALAGRRTMAAWARRSSIRSSSAPAAWARRRSTSWRRRGQRVLGLEQFTIPHELGSSAGATRIFRFAYFEHPSYVPLMRLSFARWQALERDFGERLLTVTGGLDIGLPDGRVVSGAKAACRAHGLTHEVLRASEVARRYPAWRLPSEFEAVLPARGRLPARRPGDRGARDAGPPAGRRRARERARARLEGGRRPRRGGDGAGPLRGRRARRGGGRVVGQGARLRLPGPRGARAPGRRLVQDGAGTRSRPRRFPCSSSTARRAGNFYGLPERAAGEGFKVGRFHHRGETVDPDTIDRRIAPEDEAVLTWHRPLPVRADGRAGRLQDLHVRELAGRALHRRSSCPSTATWRSPPASRATATSSAPASARSWPISPCTARHPTTRACSASRGLPSATARSTLLAGA